MTCPAQNQKLTPAACPEHILGVSDSRELLRCRACPRGQALMATVRIGDNYCEPEEDCTPNSEEKPVEKQTYTMKELAALLGVPPKAVSNARYTESKNPVPGTKMAEVRDGMAARGIAWDQVVNSRRGRKPETEAAGVAPVPAEETAVPAPAGKAVHDAPEADIAGAVAGMEPDEGPRSPVKKELPLGQAIARELYTWELQEDAAKRLTGQGPIPGTIGAKMTLENILAELGRRLPGATLTVPLG